MAEINRYTIKKRRLKHGRIKCFKSKDGDFFVSDWLRNRNTIEFLGIWEEIHN